MIGIAFVLPFMIFAFLGTVGFILILAFQIFCVALAPFAGLILAANARKRGIGVWPCLLIGATYSAFLLIPWVYLLRHTRDRRFPFHSIKSTYRWAYLLRLGIVAFSPAPILLLGFMNASSTPPWILILTPILIAVVIWRISARHLSHIPPIESAQVQEETRNLDLKFIPQHMYILPFVYASATIISIPLTWICTSIGFEWIF